MHEALEERAVAEEGDGDLVLAANLRCQRHAGRVRHLRADDAVGAHETQRRVEEVHGAALAFGKAGLLAQHLADGTLGVHAARQRVVVAAIGAGQVIVLAQRGGHADCRTFVADGGVHRAADLARLRKFQQRLLDAANQKHHAVHRQQLLVGQDGRRPRDNRLGRWHAGL